MSTVTSVTPPRTRASRKEILGWAMFDFANQAYTLLIITVVFGELFTTVIVGDRGDGYRLANFLWSLALAVSYLLVVRSEERRVGKEWRSRWSRWHEER